MSQDYRTPADDVDLDAQERAIRRDGTIAFVATLALFVAGYYGLPALFDFPTNLAERLAFAASASLFVALWVLIGVGMVSTGRRKSPQDIGGSAAGPPSEHIAIESAFLQNTLEQAVIAVVFIAALAAVASGPWLALIAVTVVVFGTGRVLFYRGYPDGAAGRALGMSLTMMPAIIGYPLVIGLMIAGLL